ncbi:MAG: SDR family NAD(P)-dependent oxidoreductase [Candidatus Puniceispirillaceae bacterium]
MSHRPKTILITGCSSGIGLDSALALQARGWQVFATCRRQADCDRLQTDFGLTSFVLDYEVPQTITKAVEQALSLSGGTIDALFNNGAYAIPGATEDVPTDAMRAIFEANVFGWHELTRQILPYMRCQGRGRILQNSSVLGFAAMRYRGPYNATKFAIEGLTDTMRLELQGSGVDIILIEPGPIRTKIRENSYPHFTKWISPKGSAHEAVYRKALIPRLAAKETKKDMFELEPEAVTKVVIHALESRRPKLRYRVTWATTFMMIAKRILSTRLMDRFVKPY